MFIQKNEEHYHIQPNNTNDYKCCKFPVMEEKLISLAMWEVITGM